jgi:hypothetical protein
MAELVRVGVGGEVDISVNLESWEKILLGYDRDAFPLFTDGVLHHSKGDDDWIFEFLPLGHDLIHDGKRDNNMRLLAALPIDGMVDLKFLYPAFPIGSPVRIRITRAVAERLARRCDIAIAPSTPRWDSGNLALRYGSVVCRQYKRRNAANQFAILNAFQAAGWTRSIESPFGPHDRTLRETIDELNAGLAKPSPIRFAVEERKPVWYSSVAPACSG